MSKIEGAREILKELQVPAKQQADLCCYVLLAMADIKEDDVIVYKNEDKLITHRLIKLDENTLITKGDANNVQDAPITKDMVMGKVIFVIPNFHFWKRVCIIILVILIGILIVKFGTRTRHDK